MLRRALLALALLGCSASPAPTAPTDAGADARTDAPAADVPPEDAAPVTPRAQGERAPRTADCDPADPSRCLLPWPSDTFAARDPSTATGIRVRVAMAQAENGDDVSTVARSDGFSRATPVMTAVPLEIDPATVGDGSFAAIVVVAAEPGDALGARTPVRMHVVPDPVTEPAGSLLIAFPRRPLRAATEHVAVLMDSARDAGGRGPTADARTRVALGLAPPLNAEDRLSFAWNAPVRRALAAAQVDLAHVARVWTFTTRSAEQPRASLREIRAAMIRAVDEGRARVTLSSVRRREGGSIALVAEGFLEGLPNPLDDRARLRRAADGSIAFGGNDFRAPFRVMLPRGQGDYPLVLWGHGTGGDVHDSSFDDVISSAGSAKVNFEFEGWTGDRVADTFAAFTRVLDGVEQSTARLLRALGGGAAITRALLGDDAGRGAVLADVLAAPTLDGAANPAAGRRPRRARLLYTGGSLGGTLGAVFTRVEPRVEGAVLNVGGAAWTHFTPFANLFALLRPALRSYYGGDVDLWIFLAMSQSLWDDVDGAAWADAPDNRPPTLVQQSMGDPVLPNPGTEFLGAALEAVQVGAVLSPIVGATSSGDVTAGNAITQFRVPSAMRDALDVHGFAARESPAGEAARQQLSDFALSVQAGSPRITVPRGCRENTPPGSCDFSAR